MWSLWKQLQSESPDLTAAVDTAISRLGDNMYMLLGYKACSAPVCGQSTHIRIAVRISFTV